MAAMIKVFIVNKCRVHHIVINHEFRILRLTSLESQPQNATLGLE